MNGQEVAIAEIDKLHERLVREAEVAGYHLNPDVDFTKGLIRSLIINKRRYGYWACPCRLASGMKQDDLDIICPCDYRDIDLNEYDVCYCALYVSNAVRKGEKKAGSIPERRPPPEERKRKTENKDKRPTGFSLPVWRCKVCGYLCAREQPPEVCPICKAKKSVLSGSCSHKARKQTSQPGRELFSNIGRSDSTLLSFGRPCAAVQKSSRHGRLRYHFLRDDVMML